MKIKFYIEYVVFRSIYCFVRILPEFLSLRFGIGLGKAAYLFDGKHRKIALDNLRASTIGSSDQERIAIIKGNYQSLGINIVEFLRLSLCNKSWFEKNVEVQGQEYVKEAFDAGKGLIFLTAHFGNWELLGGMLCNIVFKDIAGAEVYGVGRPMKNKLIDEMVCSIRSSVGPKILPKKNVLKDLLLILKQNKAIGLLSDQNAGHDGVFVDFLGREASTVTSPVIFSIKTGAKLIPVFCLRQSLGKYKLIFERALDITQTGNFSKDVYENTQKFTKKIEEYVKQYPAQWFWLHRRWKTKRQDVKNLKFANVYND